MDGVLDRLRGRARGCLAVVTVVGSAALAAIGMGLWRWTTRPPPPRHTPSATEAFGTGPFTSDEQIQRALIFVEEDNLEAAEEALQDATALASEEPYPWEVLATVRAQREDFAGAADAQREALRQLQARTGGVPLYMDEFRLGCYLFWSNQDAEATEHLNRAFEGTPAAPPTRQIQWMTARLVWCLWAQGRDEEAFAVYGRYRRTFGARMPKDLDEREWLLKGSRFPPMFRMPMGAELERYLSPAGSISPEYAARTNQLPPGAR